MIPLHWIRIAVLLGAIASLAACSRGGDDALTGYAEAGLVYVAASAAGTLDRLAAERGAQVEKGAVLFSLDNDAEEFARAAAQADNLRNGRRAQEIAAIEQQLSQARANPAASKSLLERTQQLVKLGFVARTIALLHYKYKQTLD